MFLASLSVALAAPAPDACPAYHEPALPVAPRISENAEPVLLSAVCGTEDEPKTVQERRVVVDAVTGDACWIAATDVEFVPTEDRIHVSTRLHLVNPTRVRVSGVTWTVGDGGDRLAISGTGSDVDLDGNIFLEVGSRTTVAAAIRVRVEGRRDSAMERVRVANNEVYRVTSGHEGKDEVKDEVKSNAYGFQFVVPRRTQRLTDLRVERNQLGVSGLRLDTGYSEVIALNGSLCNFRVTQNHVAHYVNIGIDAMGGESQGPGIPQQGRFDHNLVASFEWDEDLNPRPGFALYSDGGANIRFDHNAVWDVYEGMEASAENSVRSDDITFEDNLVTLRAPLNMKDNSVRRGRGFRIGPYHLFASVSDVHAKGLEVLVKDNVDQAVVVERRPGRLGPYTIEASVAGFSEDEGGLALSGVERMSDVRKAELAAAATGCDLFELLPDTNLRPAGCPGP